MKRLFMIGLVASAFALFLTACNKSDENNDTTEGETIEVSINVNVGDDNSATVTAEQTSGNFYAAKIIVMMEYSEVTVDLSSEVSLTNFIIENGVDVELPYTETFTGLRVGYDKFSAVVAYDSSGRAAATAYQVWTPQGDALGWSEENNPGELEEIEW